ncbi:MAG: hypothetical protein HKN23_13150 [Verrucomicrobiales bacterium]|nr:hypothetical protein [Verrucomicrobiales bacterium]
MFRKTTIAIILWITCLASAAAQERELRILPLDSHALPLKTVFDAGLRPRHVARLERVVCKIGKEDFAISVDDRAPIEIKAEWASFNVNANDEVTTFEARERNLYTLDEVLEIASAHLETLGIGTEKLAEWEARQRAGMEKAAKSSWPFIGAGNFSDGKWYGDRNMKAGVKIMSTYQEKAPFTLQYYAQWRSVLSMESIRREPIKPPAGYEHISMDPYPSSNDKPGQPARGVANEAPKSVRNDPLQKHEIGTKSAKPLLIVGLIGIMGVVVVVVLIFRSTRKRSDYQTRLNRKG